MINMHDHSHEHGHTHEQYSDAGKYSERELPDYSNRNFEERGFTIGIGGPVGSGKTALTLALCQKLRTQYNIATVTNDIFTKEDQEFLIKNRALPQNRWLSNFTGGLLTVEGFLRSKQGVVPMLPFARTSVPTWELSRPCKQNLVANCSS